MRHDADCPLAVEPSWQGFPAGPGCRFRGCKIDPCVMLRSKPSGIVSWTCTTTWDTWDLRGCSAAGCDMSPRHPTVDGWLWSAGARGLSRLRRGTPGSAGRRSSSSGARSDRQQYALFDPARGRIGNLPSRCSACRCAACRRTWRRSRASGASWRKPSSIPRGSREPAAWRPTGWPLAKPAAMRDPTAAGWRADSRSGWFVRPLHRTAQAAFSGLDEPASCGVGRPGPELLDAGRLRSLYDCLREIPEYRSARGIRHGVASVQAIAVAGKLAGARGPPRSPSSPGAAHATPVGGPPRLPQSDHGAPDAPVEIQHSQHSQGVGPRRPGQGRAALDDRAARPRRDARAGRQVGTAQHLLWRRPGRLPDRRRRARQRRGARTGRLRQRRWQDPRRTKTPRQTRRDRKNRYPRRPAQLPRDRSADRQPGRGLCDARQAESSGASRRHPDSRLEPRTIAANPRQGARRLEERTCSVVSLDGQNNHLAPLPGRRQAFRIIRRRTVLKTGSSSVEVAYDEDRFRVRNRKLPRNIACRSNAAISIPACARPSGISPRGASSLRGAIQTPCVRSSTPPPDTAHSLSRRPDPSPVDNRPQHDTPTLA